MLLLATLRIPFNLPQSEVGRELEHAVRTLRGRLPEASHFEVTLTANLLTKSSVTERYGVWFGQCFGDDPRNELSAPEVYELRGPTSASRILPTSLPLEHFETVWRRRFPDSSVHIMRCLNLVYIFKSYLPHRSSWNALTRRIIKVY